MDTLMVASCSRAALSPRLVNSQLPQEKKKKAKKIRRKPRPSKKKSADEVDFDSDEKMGTLKTYCCQELSSALYIEPVCKSLTSVFIRKRSTRFRYIKLHTFITSCVPTVFKSRLNNVNTISAIEESFLQITINDNSTQHHDKPRFTKREKSSKSSKKKTALVDRKPHPLKGYISTENAEDGLKKGTLIKGVIRINPKNSREAYVSNENRNVQDYMILTMDDRNGAMEGDEVVLEIKPESEWKDGKATASVVYILKRVNINAWLFQKTFGSKTKIVLMKSEENVYLSQELVVALLEELYKDPKSALSI